MKWNNKGKEFDSLGNCFKGKRIILFGCTAENMEVYLSIKWMNVVEAFVDREKVGTKVDDIPVISVSDFSGLEVNKYVVVVGYPDMFNFRSQAHRQIVNLGYEYGRNFFMHDVFLYYYIKIIVIKLLFKNLLNF